MNDIKRTIVPLCQHALQQQLSRGEISANGLHNRRRVLVKQVLKRIPKRTKRNPERLMSSAVLILAGWGLLGVNPVEAASNFVAQAGVLNPLDGFDVGDHAKPRLVDIDNDGDFDAFVGRSDGNVKFYRNTGTASAPVFASEVGPLDGFDVGNYASPSFADIDNDGDLDAFVGELGGIVKFYRNTGTISAPVFASAVGALDGFSSANYSAPSFVDIDNDGDLDAFVGKGSSTFVRFYRNTGTVSAPVFALEPGALDSFINVLSSPSFVDIDNDGDLDAFIGETGGAVKFYRNTGTVSAPVFAPEVGPLDGLGVGAFASPSLVDIDNDGDLDAFIGYYYGETDFFKNIDPQPTLVDDALLTTENTPATTGDVIANDVFRSDGPVGLFTLTVDVATAQGGTVTNNNDNTFTYLPPIDYIGSDTFTYRVDDGAGTTASATVMVTVTADPSSGSSSGSSGGSGIVSGSGGCGSLSPWFLLLTGLLLALRQRFKSARID